MMHSAVEAEAKQKVAEEQKKRPQLKNRRKACCCGSFEDDCI
jgi:hypothetical protein